MSQQAQKILEPHGKILETSGEPDSDSCIIANRVIHTGGSHVELVRKDPQRLESYLRHNAVLFGLQLELIERFGVDNVRIITENRTGELFSFDAATLEQMRDFGKDFNVQFEGFLRVREQLDAFINFISTTEFAQASSLLEALLCTYRIAADCVVQERKGVVHGGHPDGHFVLNELFRQELGGLVTAAEKPGEREVAAFIERMREAERRDFQIRHDHIGSLAESLSAPGKVVSILYGASHFRNGPRMEVDPIPEYPIERALERLEGRRIIVFDENHVERQMQPGRENQVFLSIQTMTPELLGIYIDQAREAQGQ